MYFTHVVAACEGEPDPEPPTRITIAPATVQDLFDQAPPEEVDPELGTPFGVTPIQGTIWNLQRGERDGPCRTS
jgi:hypothetical protein